MSFKDKKPETKSDKFRDGTATHRFYEEEEMDKYLAIIEPKAEKLDELFPNSQIIEETGGTMCELLIEQAGKLEAVKTARDKLYEDLPAGEVDAFTLLKIIQAHIAELDRIRETS